MLIDVRCACRRAVDGSLRRWSCGRRSPFTRVALLLTVLVHPTNIKRRVALQDGMMGLAIIHKEVVLTWFQGKPSRAPTEPSALAHHCQCCEWLPNVNKASIPPADTKAGETERSHYDVEQESPGDQHPEHGHRACRADVQKLSIKRSFPS